MVEADMRIASIAAEYEVSLIGKSKYPEPGETRAVASLLHILNAYGEGHLRMVLSTLAETENNRASLDAVSLWCVSDLIRAFPQLVENETSEWLSCFDAMPVGELMYVNNQCLRGVVKLRHSLAGMLTERIYRRFGPRAAQPDLFDDRRKPTIAGDNHG